MDTKGLLVRLEVKAGYDDAMAEDVLRSALARGRAEPGTPAWFAIRLGRSEYGIFDVFPDDAEREAHLAGPVTQALLDAGGSVFAEAPHGGRFAHLTGHVPRKLARHSLSLLGSLPDIGMLDVVDTKWADQSAGAR